LRRERLLSEYVPWQDFIADDMMLNRDASVFMMVSLDGLPFETINDPIINYQHERLEAVVREHGQDGLTFHFLHAEARQIRRCIRAVSLPVSSAPRSTRSIATNCSARGRCG
jgi:type IV secretory pathway VirB4 component